MIPNPIRGFRSRVINALICALREQRPIAGAGISLLRSAQGTIISCAAKAASAASNEPEPAAWQCRVVGTYTPEDAENEDQAADAGKVMLQVYSPLAVLSASATPTLPDNCVSALGAWADVPLSIIPAPTSSGQTPFVLYAEILHTPATQYEAAKTALSLITELPDASSLPAGAQVRYIPIGSCSAALAWRQVHLGAIIETIPQSSGLAPGPIEYRSDGTICQRLGSYATDGTFAPLATASGSPVYAARYTPAYAVTSKDPYTLATQCMLLPQNAPAPSTVASLITASGLTSGVNYAPPTSEEGSGALTASNNASLTFWGTAYTAGRPETLLETALETANERTLYDQ